MEAAGTSEGAKKAWDTRGRSSKDMDHEEIHTRLAHAITEHDRRSSTKPYYDRNALGLSLAALHEVMEKVKGGSPVRQAILQHFNAPLSDKMLKIVGESRSA